MVSANNHEKNKIGQLGIIFSISLLAQESFAACNLVSGLADDSYVCDSGVHEGDFFDYGGSNTLTFPASGSGAINGSVTFGAGADTVQINSGSINGDVYQGDSSDRFIITGGSVSGGVNQGNGIDDFFMSAGAINSLSQGDNHDTFLMIGGTIKGAFEDGDTARMTGGTIGRVDMKLDNNLFDMSGGEIIGNLITGFGLDTIIISAGTVGGNISVSGGDDSITISGGVVKGEIRASTGNDRFTWSGGEINSAILLGDGDDTALLSGINAAYLSTVPMLDGGNENDQLTLDATVSTNPDRYINWETINLENSSRMELAGTLKLGDSGTGSCKLSVSSNSLLVVDNGIVSPFDSVQMAKLNNAGTIDLANTANAENTLTVFGNYVGNGGLIKLNSRLGGDSSASDRLIVSNGLISGQTQLEVNNFGGVGGATLIDGIQVVEAINSATSTDDAFSLKGSLSAGAYDYYLFKGASVRALVRAGIYAQQWLQHRSRFSLQLLAPVRLHLLFLRNLRLNRLRAHPCCQCPNPMRLQYLSIVRRCRFIPL